MMSLTFGLFTQVSGSGPLGSLVSLIYHFSLPCFWDIARYRLKYSFKGPLNPKQPTNLSFRGNIGDLLFKEKNLLLLEQTLTFKSGHQCEEPPHAQQQDTILSSN